MIYKVLHTFKDEIFVPLLAISPNVDFLFDKGEKLIVASDNIRAKVTRFNTIHVLSDEARELIKRLYGVDVYPFMKKWHSALDIASMEFVYMNLKKYEEEHREDN